MATATNYNRVVTYIEELSSVESQDHLIMWSYKVTWQFKYISVFEIRLGTQ